MSQSLWLETVQRKEYPTLEEDQKTEVLVIGGGLTGISCALELLNAGKKVILVDSNRLLHGTTGYTTSKLTVQHELIYHSIEKHLELSMAKKYYESNRKALEHVIETAGRYKRL